MYTNNFRVTEKLQNFVITCFDNSAFSEPYPCCIFQQENVACKLQTLCPVNISEFIQIRFHYVVTSVYNYIWLMISLSEFRKFDFLSVSTNLMAELEDNSRMQNTRFLRFEFPPVSSFRRLTASWTIIISSIRFSCLLPFNFKIHVHPTCDFFFLPRSQQNPLNYIVSYSDLDLDLPTPAGALDDETFPPTSITGPLRTPLQLTRISCKSSCNVCRQVFLGRPLLLLPPSGSHCIASSHTCWSVWW